MKKKIIILSLFLFFINLNVLASSGSIKQSSVILCDGVYYGSHSDHWHIVKKENNKYVIKDNKELEAPSCYLNKKNEKEIVNLSKCVDGDTAKFKMSDGSIKTARFLAIDTPESVHPTKEVEAYGKEASKFTCDLLTNAKEIEVEYDKASEREDKYGRILVWVYVDNKLVQETLLEKGLAKVAYLYANYEYTPSLQKIEKIARDKKINIWSGDEIINNLEIDQDLDIDDNDKEDKDFLQKLFDFLKELITCLFNSVFKNLNN